SFLSPGLRRRNSSTAPFENASNRAGRPSVYFDHVSGIFGSPSSLVCRLSTAFVSKETRKQIQPASHGSAATSAAGFGVAGAGAGGVASTFSGSGSGRGGGGGLVIGGSCEGEAAGVAFAPPQAASANKTRASTGVVT